ncbi:penicillin-binding protein activator [Shewanella sp. YIC-542]|uniref:penicillin-binding protein activator n=1 Tax=Shewanella mytili TaxID=3377111 RepID=UPI00398E834E
MLKSQNLIKPTIAVLLLASLWGCASGPTQPVAPSDRQAISLQTATQAPAAYLAQAAKASNAQHRQRLMLLAAKAYLDDNQTTSAAEILNALQHEQRTDAELMAQYRYLQARVLEQQGQLGEALGQLQFQSQWQLPQWQWNDYHQMRARLYEKTKQPLLQAKELSFWSQYLPATAAQQQYQQIWRLLKPLPETQLEQQANHSSDALYRGWLQLAYLAKHYAVDPASLISHLSQWQRLNPSHPAALQLPQDLHRALNTKPYHPRQIAVLLPLSGPRAELAAPLRQGIIAAYLAEPDENVSINFYDTAKGADTAYQQALTQGSDFIIGPLLPNEVDKILALQPPKLPPQTPATAATAPMPAPQSLTAPPELFLNHTAKMVVDQDKYYFALSPTQESADAAQRMYQDGIERPLLLVSNDNIGRRMAESFNASWQSLTDEAAEVHYFAPDNMRDTVQTALGVSDSQHRIKQLRSVLGSQIKADFRSRRDIDAIYMICSNQALPLLKPYIDVNFSVFAEPVPIYTSSRARQHDNRQTVQELNNITISDIPWLLQHDGDSTVATLWPTWGSTQKRLYAMGFDALQLVNKLAQMRAFPGYQFSGRTGLISVDNDGVLNRQLQWGKYRHGVLRPQ